VRELRSAGQHADAPPEPGGRLAYVLKMYPRFSETFIVSELLAREAAGEQIEIVSLRPPVDGRFHETLAAVRAPVTYLRPGAGRVDDLWALLRRAQAGLPGLPDVLPELLRAEVGDAAQAVELALLVRDRGIGHLHAHFASVATTVARLAGRLAGVPYSFTAHAKDIFHDSVDPDDLRRKLADAHHVVTVSDYNRGFLQSRYGPAAGGVTRVYNGVDLALFRPHPVADRPPVVAAVGRLVEKKGFDVLVRACARLAATGRPLRCVIAGTGPLGPQLAAQVQTLGLAGVVDLAGPLPQAAVRQLVAGAAAFAAPCVVGADGNQDGLPTVLIEAMALGTPVVSTDVTGIPELLADGVTGLAVPQHDDAALAAALARLLDDPGLRERLARAARALVERDFDSRRQAGQLAALLAAPAAQAVA
jgi:colanic acid/amylovoran biosynthesis glycosyltransferase